MWWLSFFQINIAYNLKIHLLYKKGKLSGEKQWEKIYVDK